MEYVRVLGKTEAERYYIRIAKKSSKDFPEVGIKFTLVAHNKEHTVKLDRQYRIWCGFMRYDSEFKLGVSYTISDDEIHKKYVMRPSV